MRISAGEALGYEIEGPAVFNLRLPEPATHPFESNGAPVAAFFHATSKDDKKWPVGHWVAIGRELAQRGFQLVLPWGSEGERLEAEQIASQLPGATVLPKLSVTEIAQMIDACSLVVGTDTGFVHLAHALQKRTVMIFVATPPSHYGIESPFRSISIGDGQSVPPISAALEAIDYVHTETHDVAVQHGSTAV
jgi:heptosyltransferase-1